MRCSLFEAENSFRLAPVKAEDVPKDGRRGKRKVEGRVYLVDIHRLIAEKFLKLGAEYAELKIRKDVVDAHDPRYAASMLNIFWMGKYPIKAFTRKITYPGVYGELDEVRIYLKRLSL